MARLKSSKELRLFAKAVVILLFLSFQLTQAKGQATYVTEIPADHTFCLVGTPVTLTGFNPGGKLFAGPGITDNGDGTATFDPSAAGLGTHTITYDGARWSTTVTVEEGPVVTLTPFASVCADEPAFELTGGSPAGGTYTGTGVDGAGFFDPAAAGPGTHEITYTNTAGTCSSSAVETITVFALPVVTLAAFPDVCETDAAFALSGGSPGGGTYSGPGVDGSGNFDPSIAGVGTHTITYTYSDGNCTNTATSSLTVNAIPTASFAGLAAKYCTSDAPVNLTGTPTDANGVFSGPGIFDNNDGTAVFDPATAGLGTHTISYIYTNADGCSDTYTQDVQVGTEITMSGLPASYCIDEPDVNLISSPAGGTYTPMAALTDHGDGTATFDLSVAGVGTHNIEYTYVDAIGCINVSSNTITVNPLPTPTFVGLPASICLNETPVSLTGNYAGGSFLGLGISDNGDGTATFDPASAGVGGPYDITYQYTDANGCTASIINQVTVQALPSANISGDATICEGNATPIDIALTGAAPYDFTYTDGTNNYTEINYAAANYTTNLSPVADQVYTVSDVTDANGCTTAGTGSATITVNPQVNITTQPTNKNICPGGNTNFQVVANGVDLTYQWQKDGANIAGATNPVLALNNVDATDVGSYQCIVSSATCGAPETSTAATLNLYSPTAITTQPTDDYLCTGEDLQLVVAATGSNLTYQWQKDGVSIADGGDISGATTNTLIISNVTTAEAGDYTCIVTGECGTLISGIAQVTIDAQIVITSQPTSKTLCPGVNASFSTTATGTNLTFQWYKDGAAIAGETSQSLILNTIDATDAADYSCQISSSCGATLSTNTVALNINSETQIITQPATTTECLGANASFEVDAQGTSLTYQWYKDGAAMADGGDIAGATSSQLIISNVDLTDEADYTCDVMGTCGMETTLPAQLIVDDNITVTTQPVSQTLCEGNNASFSVVASGSGLTYQWQKDGVDIAGATNDFINLPNVTDADEGNYRCVISNACGQVVNSSAATLVVNDLTIITTQPSDLWECEGTNVNFTIAADGSNVNYQWFKDGAPLANGGNISGANSANLAVNSITAADEGEYYCEATGDCGIDVSDRAELFVDNNISITQQPASQLVCEGDNITVEVIATGANLTYQWQKDGVDIAGATLAQLSLNAVTVADEADYRCVIENTCGIQVTSQAATISLYNPAAITTQPADAVLCEGEEANFSVTATGPSLTYQWFKDGTALADGADISGSTTSTLTLTNITLAENGVYSCQVTAPCNTVITNPATLTVQENTQITTQPTNKNYCQGENGQFSVQATGSNLTYQWQKDGVDIPGETNSGISIANVSIADEGVYRCVVSGDCGTITSNGAQLTLNTPVTITTDPANLVVCEDQTADFSVTASGTGLTYQWRKDGVDLTDNASISGSTSANLSIDPVVLADGGVYTCVVTGTCDQAVSSPASLTVNEEVVITQQPTNKQSCEGDDVTFSVLATGTNITYQWQKDGVDIAGENASSLQLTNVIPADDGVYRCVLTGTCNTIASDGVSLTLGESTQITTNPTPKTLCEGLTANFSVVASGSNLTYQWKQDGVNLTNSATISGANSPDLSISNISTANAGVYTCEVVGDCGTQNSSPANLIVNEGTVITDHPDNLTACPGEDANFSVTATGTNLTYQWQLDGANIPGETSSGLTVTNISDADEGIYRCVITNSCGTVNSNGASLVVDEAVNITTQPVANVAVCQGDNLTLNVATTGTGVTYQWQKDGSNLSDGGNISGTNSQNLNINNATVVDDGIYNVIVTGSCATITSDFSDVVVNPTTSITQQPANYTAVAGGTAIFSVEADGDNLTYQWQKDGADLSDGGIISGATTPDLTLTGVAESDEGAYRCVVTGTCNTANSSPANLVVNPTTVITTQPTSKVKCEGESANFSVTTDGTGYTFQWKKDGVNLADNANISGSTTANLAISATSLSDAGAYTCEVSGENSAPAILEVHENTIVTTQPTAKTRCVGDNLVFSIEASGHNLTYQWQKDGVDLSDGGTLSGATTETLTISAVDLTDMGDYTCVVTGSCGTANSDPAALVVYENTSIATQPAGATICEQGSHTFSMVTTGDNLSYSWTKNGNPIADGGNISGATTANLVISNATLSDAGAYVGTVAGNCGSETSVIAQLEVQPATAITLQPVDFTGCEGESVTLSVLADGTALNFQWQKDGIDVSDGAILSGTTTPNLTLAGLTAAEAGTYVCVVTGACGTQNSQPAEVAIYNQTQITTQPTGTVVCHGDAVSLSVQADGSNLSYQWKKGANNVVNDANISGSNTANLTIASAELTDAGAYYCVVTGSCGEEISNLANVDVEKQTQVLTQPTDVYSCNAKDVSFIVDATGENLNYQWQKDGVDLTDNATISGSNTPLLELASITSTEAGDYRCVVSGNCGTVNSDPAQLVVYNTVQITSQPSDKTLCEGEQISLNLTAIGDNLTYQWKRDGVAISDGGDISGTQTPNLVINNATIAESGIYSCQVSASCGTENSLPVRVDVALATVITQQPTSIATCEVDLAVFTVNATGQNLTYQWQKDGVDLSDGGTIFGTNSAQLTINNLTNSDAGAYRCIITGDCGTINSDAADLAVGVYPDAAGNVDGPTDICQGAQGILYEVPAIYNATTYQWNLPLGVTILSGAGTRAIEVYFEENELGGNITVQGVNSCGIGPESPVLHVEAHPKPEANAGPDQSLCTNTTTLAATDPGSAIGTWSVLNGPAQVQDVHAFDSQINNLREGINTLIWTVEENSCSASDTVIITNNHVSVNAGIDETICAEFIIMQGSSVPAGAVGSWSVLSGSANFTDGNDPLTEATDFASGPNELQWTVTKGGCSFSDQITIDNQRPTEAYAGIDQSICSDSTNLSANEALIGTGSWSVIAGSATFVDGTDPNTKVTGLGQGDNILRWTISNGICSTIDEVTITNNQLNPDGGIDQVICSRTTTLEAQAPATGTGNWSVVEGAATFVNNNQHNTVVTGLAKGENVLVWNINNNGCISSDTVSITNDSPTKADAGPDQTLTENFTTLQGNIPAVGVGEWSLLSGSADIADSSLYNTNVTNLALGENIFRWTITHNSCISYDDVIINNYMSTQTDAGADQTLCGETTTLDGNEPNFGFGEWSVIQGAATFADNSNPKTEVTGLAKGENILRWSVWENGWTHDDVVITNDAPTDANAGVDQLLCADNTTLAGNEPIIGNGQWTVISGSGNFTDDMSYNTQVTDLAKGENIFKWTITNKSCSSSDLVKIINQSPTTADAGEDITTCVDTVVLSPNTPSIGTASWSIMSGSANFDGNVARNLATGPNTLRYTIENDGCISFDDVIVTNNEPSDANAGADKVICVDSIYLSASTPVVGQGIWTIQSGSATIEDPTDPNTKVTQLNQGINVFRWTVEYNGCTKYDEVTIKNSLVVAEAGVDQTVCSESTVLEANNPSAGTGSWSVLGGSGSATFESIDQPDTRVTGLDQGTNVLRWTITNDICTSYDEVDITNDLPSEAFAGPDQALCTNEAQLQANTPLVGTGQWTVLSGSATIADPADPNTSVTNLSFGVNTLRWTITNGTCTSTDEVVLTNNGTEVSNAGIDQTLCADSTLLYANNPSFGEGQWSVVSGSATFADNSNHQTQVKDLGKGENVLRWSISNGTCASTDDVIVTNNSPTTAIAGADQTICGDETYLQANTPAIGTGSWSLVSGAAIFTNASQNNTQVTNLNPGSNTLRWTIESNGCISQDEVTIFNDLPFEADAGEDFAICGDSAPLYANDPGTGTGQWMVISGAGTFDDPSNFNATVSDLGFGANTLRWTITNDQCTTYDEIIVTNNSIDVNAGPDQTVNESSTLLVASNPSAGTGQWSVIGGSGSFDDATNPITEVQGLGAGLNTYRWSVDVNGCISYDDVSVTYNVPPTASFVISKSAGCPPLEVYFVNNSLDNLEFSWDFDDGTTSQEVTVKHIYETPGIYRPSITVLAPNGEQVTKDTLITVHEQPEASFMVVDKEVYIPDEQATFISTSSDAVRYLWEFGDNETSEEQDPKHTYENAGIYDVALHIWSEYNCYDSIQMGNALEVFESGALEFPNAFTPNPEGPSYGYYNPDDFSNDVFFPIGEGVDEYHLEIFNKWGILVFESFDINIGWDGYRDEELMEEGVYVYKVSGTYNNGKPFKQVGTVLLLRQ